MLTAVHSLALVIHIYSHSVAIVKNKASLFVAGRTNYRAVVVVVEPRVDCSVGQ